MESEACDIWTMRTANYDSSHDVTFTRISKIRRDNYYVDTELFLYIIRIQAVKPTYTEKLCCLRCCSRARNMATNMRSLSFYKIYLGYTFHFIGREVIMYSTRILWTLNARLSGERNPKWRRKRIRVRNFRSRTSCCGCLPEFQLAIWWLQFRSNRSGKHCKLAVNRKINCFHAASAFHTIARTFP
jgi:hypothetical protein